MKIERTQSQTTIKAGSLVWVLRRRGQSIYIDEESGQWRSQSAIIYKPGRVGYDHEAPKYVQREVVRMSKECAP